MMYCSLDEAWGNNSISKFYNLNNNIKLKENFDNDTIEEFSSVVNSDCSQKRQVNKVYQHIKKCKKCQKKLYDKLSKKFNDNTNNNLLNYCNNFIKKNNNTIVLILLGISILIFLNLVNSIFKKIFN